MRSPGTGGKTSASEVLGVDGCEAEGSKVYSNRNFGIAKGLCKACLRRLVLTVEPLTHTHTHTHRARTEGVSLLRSTLVLLPTLLTRPKP